MGAAMSSLIINLSRQGIIYIPALFILNSVMGTRGLVWAQPVADILSTCLAVVLYLITSEKMMKQSDATMKQSKAIAQVAAENE